MHAEQGEVKTVKLCGYNKMTLTAKYRLCSSAARTVFVYPTRYVGCEHAPCGFIHSIDYPLSIPIAFFTHISLFPLLLSLSITYNIILSKDANTVSLGPKTFAICIKK